MERIGTHGSDAVRVGRALKEVRTTKTDIDVETPDEVVQIKSGFGQTDHTIPSVKQIYETLRDAMRHQPPKKATFAINKDAADRVSDVQANLREALEQLKATGYNTPIEIKIELIDFSSLDIQ